MNWRRGGNRDRQVYRGELIPKCVNGKDRPAAKGKAVAYINNNLYYFKPVGSYLVLNSSSFASLKMYFCISAFFSLLHIREIEAFVLL